KASAFGIFHVTRLSSSSSMAMAWRLRAARVARTGARCTPGSRAAFGSARRAVCSVGRAPSAKGDPRVGSGGTGAEDEGIRVDQRGAVLWLTIDRPRTGNALTPDDRVRLAELLSAAEEDVTVRSIVLTATGDAFCTGADLRSSAGPPP